MQGGTITPQRLVTKALQTKRYSLSIAVVVFIIVLGLGMVWTKRYYASAQVRIYQPQHIAGSMTHDLLRVEDRLRTIYEEITSYDFLAAIAHDLNMDRGVEQDSREHQKLIRGMVEHVQLKVKNQDLFRVAYLGLSPHEARDVADKIVKKYLENSSRFYEHITSKTENFLETELAEAYRDLTDAQEDVLAYSKANINVIPEAQLTHMERKKNLEEVMQTDKGRYDSLKRQLHLAKKKLDTLPREIVLEETIGGESRLAELKDDKLDLEFKIVALLNDFTEEHWAVKDARQNLAMIERQLEAEEENTTDTSTKKMGPNPEHATLSEIVTQIELEIGKLGSGIKSSAEEMVKLDDYLAEIPEHQLKIERLSQVKSAAFARVLMYNKRLSEAKVTSQQDRKGQGPAFEIIDRPRLPIKPHSPSLKKIAAIGLVLAFGAAGALIVLLTFLDRAVRTIDEARQLLQMPVLGVMQRIVTAKEELKMRRRRKRRVIGLSAGVTMMIALVIVGYVYWLDPIKDGVGKISRYLAAP
jgi:uncharacterized protein involved in exopolysaccharide biosynthesis